MTKDALGSKYTPDWKHVDLQVRFEVLKQVIKGRSTIALFHKYPHLANQVIIPTAKPVERENVPVVMKVDSRDDLIHLRDYPKEQLTRSERQLLICLLKEYLIGETISPSVLKKVYWYLVAVIDNDKVFRDQLLGGIPNSNCKEFAGRLFKRVATLLSKNHLGDKLVRMPVHVAVQTALNEL